MLIAESDKCLANPCNDSMHGSAEVVVFTLESDLVDMRPDLLAALNIVLRCHGYPPVSNSQFRGSAESGPSALVDTFIGDSEYPGIAERSDLIARQLWNVFLMRECQSSALMPKAAASIRTLEAAGTKIRVKSFYPVDFAQAVLERFQLAQCTVVPPQCGSPVDSLRYGWHAAGVLLRYPRIHISVRAENSESLQEAA